MNRKSHRMEWSAELRPDPRGASAGSQELPVRVDIDRMKRALAGPSIEIPKGLSREELRAFILAAAKRHQ